MTLSKRELMEEVWISIGKRLPPNSADQVMLYNERTGYISVWMACEAREFAKMCINDNVVDKKNGHKNLSWDRECTHWAPVYPPTNGITYAQYCLRKRGRRRA